MNLEKEYNLKIFTDNIEEQCLDQIELLLKQKPFQDCKVRIMPDTHAGKGCVIGFTANLGDKIIPNIVGVDIGCGMLCANLGKIDIDLQKFDEVVNKYIPAGRNIREHKIVNFDKVQELYCLRELKDTNKFVKAIGTLGGGNHFIELNQDDEDNKYLVIHTGSRNMGNQVATYYQELAIQLCSGKEEMFNKKEEIIKTYKEQGIRKEIQSALKALEKEYQEKKPELPNELCYLKGKYREMYLHDMKICQEYASLNRRMIAEQILKNYFEVKSTETFRLALRGDVVTDDIKNWEFSGFETIHNYINFKDNIVRKGAISAYKDEMVIIPMNMRDGSLICIGKGNEDWNNSAPHGAGRIMSRGKARELVNMEEYKETMQGIYTTSVNESTIDEAPMVYKPMQEIIDNIQDTIDIIKIIKPIYNFKAGE